MSASVLYARPEWRDFMIDYEALREALRNECYAAHFGGGIGPALMDALDVDDMSPEELVEAARMWGVDIRRFTI